MAASTSYLVLLFVCLMSVISGCQPPDCDRPDCGTCGNACCSLEFHFKEAPADLYNAFKTNLMKGGADGRYRFINGSDLRPYNISAQFIMQAEHTTLVHHYNDTLNFAFSMPGESGMSMVRGFSISKIAGAYCDDGQNYKNLVGFVKGLGIMYEEHPVAGAGCKKQG